MIQLVKAISDFITAQYGMAVYRVKMITPDLFSVDCGTDVICVSVVQGGFVPMTSRSEFFPTISNHDASLGYVSVYGQTFIPDKLEWWETNVPLKVSFLGEFVVPKNQSVWCKVRGDKRLVVEIVSDYVRELYRDGYGE